MNHLKKQAYYINTIILLLCNISLNQNFGDLIDFHAIQLPTLRFGHIDRFQIIVELWSRIPIQNMEIEAVTVGIPSIFGHLNEHSSSDSLSPMALLNIQIDEVQSLALPRWVRIETDRKTNGSFRPSEMGINWNGFWGYEELFWGGKGM